jgi:hypothetical protein
LKPQAGYRIQGFKAQKLIGSSGYTWLFAMCNKNVKRFGTTDLPGRKERQEARRL